MSWCHLAQYLSSKVLGFCRLKTSCIRLFSLSNNRKARMHARAIARTRARALLYILVVGVVVGDVEKLKNTKI
nr:MAG TPA: hypothetical protein [Microviridae sp.]